MRSQCETFEGFTGEQRSVCGKIAPHGRRGDCEIVGAATGRGRRVDRDELPEVGHAVDQRQVAACGEVREGQASDVALQDSGGALCAAAQRRVASDGHPVAGRPGGAVSGPHSRREILLQRGVAVDRVNDLLGRCVVANQQGRVCRTTGVDARVVAVIINDVQRQAIPGNSRRPGVDLNCGRPLVADVE